MSDKKRGYASRQHMSVQDPEQSPVVPFLRDQAFDPDTISLMSAAIEKICGELGVKPQSPAGEVIAAKIVELVQRGMRNPTALYLAARPGLNPVN
jgi:hypothetical protein